jgi:hypothetical protein
MTDTTTGGSPYPDERHDELDFASADDLEAVSSREHARRHAVKVILLIYLVIMLDGVLRKYLFWEFERPLTFLRDPVVLYLYFHAAMNGFVKKSALLVFGIVLSLAGLMIFLLDLFDGEMPLLILMFGIRQYFFLIPLPFIIASVLSREDLNTFYRLNMILLICMAPLMVVQVFSPQDAFINTGGGTWDDPGGFRNLGFGEFVRAPGFFTSSSGINSILPLNAAILILVHMMPREERPCSQFLFLAATAALFVAIACAGSRGAIIGAGVVGMGAIALPFLMPQSPRALQPAVLAVLLGIAAFASFVEFFPEQFAALSDRWAGANLDSGKFGDFAILYRYLSEFSYFLDVVPRTPMFGYGIGSASNAAVRLGLFAPELELIWTQVENDWARHIVELGPIVGMLYVIFRILLTLRLATLGLFRATRFGDPTPWLLFAASGAGILNGPMTGQATASGFIWFFAGVILAAGERSEAD